MFSLLMLASRCRDRPGRSTPRTARLSLSKRGEQQAVSAEGNIRLQHTVNQTEEQVRLDGRRGGGGGGGGQHSQVRDGDWPCPSCNINNFASRDKCFKCGTPKP